MVDPESRRKMGLVVIGTSTRPASSTIRKNGFPESDILNSTSKTFCAVMYCTVIPVPSHQNKCEATIFIFKLQDAGQGGMSWMPTTFHVRTWYVAKPLSTTIKTIKARAKMNTNILEGAAWLFVRDK